MVISNANVRERTFKQDCIWWHGAYMKLYPKKMEVQRYSLAA
jgi:hypothetical protein